jgi:hypothetical protein
MFDNSEEENPQVQKMKRRMWEIFWGDYYKGGWDQGIDVGKVQALRRTLVHIVQLRFPDLTEFAEEQTRLSGSDILEVLILQLVTAPDVEIARWLLETTSKRTE